MVQRLFWNSQSFNGPTAHYERLEFAVILERFDPLGELHICSIAQIRNYRWSNPIKSFLDGLAGAVLGVQRHGSDRAIAAGKKEKNT